MKAITIANGIRILKNCYGFFITSIKNCDGRNLDGRLHSLFLSLITILKM